MSGVPSLPVVGTTWLRRGAVYWVRRVGGVLLLLLGVILIAVVLVALLLGIYGTSKPAFVAACVVLAVVIAVTGFRAGRRRLPPPGDVPATRRDLRNVRLIAMYAGPAIVVLILLAIFATQVFQAVVFVLLVGFAAAAAGPYLVVFWRSLGRELPVEEQLRVGLGLPAPGDPGRAAAVDELMRDESTRD
jgi:hypothetical protein